MEAKYILYEEKDQVALITINRPDKLNALNLEVLQELSRTLDYVASREVRAVIITGAGQKAFVAGADLEEIGSFTPPQLWSFLRVGQKVFRKIEELGKPVIGAVNGMALGGGFELALACHLRVAATGASFAFPEAGLGLMAGFGGTQRLPKVIGKPLAMEYHLTGNRIKAEEAYRIGLVNHIVPAEELMAKTWELAGQITSKAPFAVTMIIEAVQSGAELDLERGEIIEAGLVTLCAATEDCREGFASWREKRKPVYSGK